MSGHTYIAHPMANTCPDLDVMVTEEVVAEEEVVEVVTIGQSSSPKPSKVLVHISDDLCYTMHIRGETLAALVDSMAADEQLKTEWHLWQHFVSHPDLFYVYIFDDDFGEYVRHRQTTPIRHLSKLRIKSRGLIMGAISAYNHFNGHSLADVFDAEPTDALIGDQTTTTTTTTTAPVGVEPLKGSDLLSPTEAIVTTVSDSNQKSSSSPTMASNFTTNTSSTLYASQYHHNYHMSSPSSAGARPPSPPTLTKFVRQSSPLSSPTPSSVRRTTASYQESPTFATGDEPSVPALKVMTKATKKLFTYSLEDQKSFSKQKSRPLATKYECPASVGGAATVRGAGDLLSDTNATVVAAHEWTDGQTITYLDMCTKYAKELAPKKNVLEVKPLVWEQLAKQMNTRGLGTFDAQMCRNHFSRLRLTYTNILCYPAMESDDTRWPYFDQMKSLIGERPVEMQPQVKTRAQTAAKDPQRDSDDEKKGSAKRKPSASVMKNNTNHDLSELYICLLNLVKKYMKYFETEKKYTIWNKIEKEMAVAGFKRNALSLRALFHRLRYHYLNVLRNVDEERAYNAWPYFRYFQCMDLSAFPVREDKAPKIALKTLKIRQKAPKYKPLAVKRQRGRPRKYPVLKQKNKSTEKSTGVVVMSGGGAVKLTLTSTLGDSCQPVVKTGSGRPRRPSSGEFDDQSTGSSDVEGVENKKKSQ